MQYRLRDINLAVVAGELPVGQAVLVETGDAQEQMYFAYRTAHEGRLFLPPDLMHACRNQFDLTKR